MAARIARSVACGVAVALALLVALPTGVAGATAAPTGARPTASGPSIAASPPAVPAEIRVAPAYTPGIGVATVGPLPASTPVDVAVGLALQNPAGLAARIAAESTPGLADFHRPMSATAAAAAFGAAPSGVAAATAYFAGFGLAVRSAPDGLMLDVQGPSGAVARAFGTSFEEYRSPGGATFWSHATPATLPAVAPWTGVLGLDNRSVAEPGVAAAGPAAADPAASCAGASGGLLPCAIEGAYNISSVLAAGNNGSGLRIAVVDAYSGDDPQSQLASDLRTFEEANGLSTSGVSFLYPVPYSGSLNTTSTNPEWGLEDSLDIEWARAVAPGASLEMTFSPNSGAGLYEAIDWLVGHDAADVISLSWGEPEVGVFNAYATPCASACNASTDGTYAILGPVLELAAVEGISVFAASGDCGAADGTSGLATNFPASDPYVTGVGGTLLTISNTTTGAWFAESGWSGNASGAASPGCQNQGGSGGGYSTLPRPYWQVGLPSSPSGRGVPDVAMDARTPVQVEYLGSPVAVIGTSVGTPIWAGIAALADAYAGGDLGLLGPSLYRILTSPAEYARDFHDITSGNNGYAAGVGWDPVTGLGTPRVDALLPDLARGGATPGGDLAVTLTATPTSGTAPLPVAFTVTPSGGSGSYPVYGVAFGNGNASLATSSTVDYTYLAAGVYTAQAFAYDSDGNATVSAPVTVVVGGGATLSVSLLVGDTTPAEAVGVDFTADVTGGSGPFLYNFSFGDGAYTVNGTGDAVVHTYCAVGAFEAYVTVRTTAHPAAGGESAPVAVTVANGTGTACAHDPIPLVLTPWTNLSVRDAPAEFPGLFSASGGSGGTRISLTSADPYTAACDCAIFETPGSYTVAGQAVDSAGRLANATVNVTVAPALVGTFTSSALAGPVPLTVDLGVAVTGGTDANAAATAWSAGDGDTSTGATAAFTYDTPGEYLAIGRLADLGDGNTSEAFLIDAEPATGTPPVGATGTIAPAQAIGSGQTVAFTATLVGGNASDVLRWNLGDGHSAYGDVANETYFASEMSPNDSLSAALAVVGPGHATVFRTALLLPSFFAVESGDFVPAVDALSLVSSFGPTLGLVPLLADGGATASGPGAVAVGWTYGNGATSAGTDGLKSYSVAGTYTAVVTATDAPFSDLAVQSTGIDANPAFDIRANLSALGGVAPLTVTGRANATGGVGGPYGFRWVFTSTSVGNGTPASHTFGSPGQYVVVLVVTDGANETGEVAWNVSVSAAAGYPLLVIVGGAAAGVILAVVLGLWASRRRRPATP
ncbi:MAG TPA: protease pro-enzyme activation domain-containing protein [Thermoplasmata archaeon]|nr:protease pro-enzyme activation domain-containing protein [Thermoplasmata archaeon]